MKRFTLLAAAGLFSMSLSAQEAKEEPKEEGFVFTTVKELPITSIKNQNRAGTCWCYSSMAFWNQITPYGERRIRLVRNVHRTSNLS